MEWSAEFSMTEWSLLAATLTLSADEGVATFKLGSSAFHQSTSLVTSFLSADTLVRSIDDDDSADTVVRLH